MTGHDAIRDALRAAGERRAAAEAARDRSMDEITRLARQARAAGLPISEIAELAGVSRPTVYSLTERDR